MHARSTLSRRRLLRLASAAAVGGVGVIVAACGGTAPPESKPATTPKPASDAKPASGEAPKPTQAAQGAAPAKPAAAAATSIRFITWWQPMENYLTEIAKRLPGEQSPVAERGLQIFHIFDRLAKRKLPPFSTREVV